MLPTWHLCPQKLALVGYAVVAYTNQGAGWKLQIVAKCRTKKGESTGEEMLCIPEIPHFLCIEMQSPHNLPCL
jgi:hypothetical protein